MNKRLVLLSLAPLVLGSTLLNSCGPKRFAEDENFKYSLKEDKTYELRYAKTELSNVTIPETVNDIKITSIANEVFANQKQLKKVTLSSNLESLGYASFMNCSELRSVVFNKDSHLKTIGDSAFCDDNKLIIDYLPNSVEKVGNFAFQFDRGISLIYLPKSIKNVGTSAFDGCNNAIFFVEASAVPTGWHETWNNSNRPYLLDVDEDYGTVETRGNFKVLVKSDEAYLISVINQSELTGELVLPISVDGVQVKSMISNLFSPSTKNSGVTSLIIPSGYGEPDVHCFDGLNCANLYFMGDNQVSSNWITEFEEIHNGSMAYTSLSDSVAVNDINYVYAKSESNYAILTSSNSTSSELSIPREVKFPTMQYSQYVEEIAPRAFRDNKSLTKITTVQELHFINAYAFYNCSNLKTIVLGDVIKIGKRAFSGSSSMSNLDTVTAHSAETIGEEAFKKTSQKQIDIQTLFPSDVRRTKYIGQAHSRIAYLMAKTFILVII